MPPATTAPASGLKALRAAPAAAWAGPLFVLLGLSLMIGVIRSDTVGATWFRARPEQWIYPLQTVAVIAAVAFWWRHYTFRPLSALTILAAVAAGVIGIVLWILPSWLYDHGYVRQIEWLGFTSRAGDSTSFDPSIWESSPGVYWTVVVLRLLRMTVAVAFAEELFWRGYLWRTVSEQFRDFHTAPFGARNGLALGATVLLFTLAHMGPDRPAAVIWCLIVSWLYVRTKSVGACVIAHAVSNLILGIYVMITRQWGFW